jgi:hypothetical protein
MHEDIIEILIHNFKDGKTLQEVREDYEALEQMIERERSANGEGSRRLAALNVLANWQLKLVLEKLVATRDKGSGSTVPAK